MNRAFRAILIITIICTSSCNVNRHSDRAPPMDLGNYIIVSQTNAWKAGYSKLAISPSGAVEFFHDGFRSQTDIHDIVEPDTWNYKHEYQATANEIKRVKNAITILLNSKTPHKIGKNRDIIIQSFGRLDILNQNGEYVTYRYYGIKTKLAKELKDVLQAMGDINYTQISNGNGGWKEEGWAKNR